MKKVIKMRTKNLSEKFLPQIKKRFENLLFAIAPMLYLWYTYGISYHGHHPIAAMTGIMCTFILFYFVHVRYIKPQLHYKDKMRLQMMLANIAIQASLFAISIDSAGKECRFGSAGMITATIIAAIIVIALAILQINDHNRSIKRTFSGVSMYQTLTGMTLMVSTIFFIYQLYVFWATWFIFVTILSSSIMLATINTKDLYWDHSDKEVRALKIIPYVFGIGIMSLIFQFQNIIVYKFKLGHIAIVCLVISIVFLILNKIDRNTLKSWRSIDGKDEISIN